MLAIAMRSWSSASTLPVALITNVHPRSWDSSGRLEIVEQARFDTGAELLNNPGRAVRAVTRALLEREVVGPTEQEPRAVGVARTGCVDNFVHRRCRVVDPEIFVNDHGALVRTRNGPEI